MITRQQFDDYILPVTLFHEGGYVNDPLDRGGETYRGISRRANPSWDGWKHLERWKPLRRGDIVNDNDLKQAVRDLYYTKYFEANSLDRLNDEYKALVLFDFAVHGGYRVSSIQLALNNMGCNLHIDGVIGPKTIAAINAASPYGFCHAVLDVRRAHLNRLIEENPGYERFEEGWLARVARLRRMVNQSCKE